MKIDVARVNSGTPGRPHLKDQILSMEICQLKPEFRTYASAVAEK
jgi:hypothetical protein